MLNDAWMDELIALHNREPDSSHYQLADRLDGVNTELNSVRLRLFRLYDALEMGKLSLDNLALPIKEQRAREAELSKARLQLEAEMLYKGHTTLTHRWSRSVLAI